MTELRRVPLDRVREARDASQVPSAVLRVDGPVSPVEIEELRARCEVVWPGRAQVVLDPQGMAPVSARRRAWRDAAARMVR